MNINQCINKIIYLLKEKDKIYKLNSFQFYSDKKDKYYTKYQIYKKETVTTINLESGQEEKIEKYNLAEEYYNKRDVLKYFLKEYEGMG